MAGRSASYRYLAYRRRRRNGHGPPRLLMAFIVLAGMGFGVVAALAATTYVVYQSYADDLIPPDEQIAKLPNGGARILDRNGVPLYEFLDDKSGLRDPVKINQISLYLIAATIDTEDTSFFDNPGVNIRGIAAAAIENLSPLESAPGFLEGRGGSSITQQLVKNIYFTQEERQKRSIKRKIRETVYALELTKQYPGIEGKLQILEWYLNSISYGNVFIGIQAASQGYFGVDAQDLTLPQAALLAGVPSCPSCYDPFNDPDSAVRQRNRVLYRMYEEGDLTGEQFWLAAAEPLQLNPKNFGVTAPHFVFNVVQPQLEQLFGAEALKRDGLVVYTTLDSGLQDEAQNILNGWIDEFEESSGGHNGAVVAMEPSSAQILAYVGSRDYFNEEIQGQNDMAAALNSPGSSFKPFTYITAFMNLGWGPGTLVLDAPIPSKYWDGKNPPRNPVAHSGPITLRNALGNSLNIPAVKVILAVGVEKVIEQAKRMGITSLDGRQLGPSMTVGGVDITLADMVYGYTAFPNLGIQKGIETTVARPPGNRELDPISILRVEDREGNILYPIIDGQPAEQPVPREVRVAPAQEAYMINSILSDGSAFCLTYGCGGLSIGRPAAFKTGTSEPYETIGLIGETWTFGYTPQIVVGSWFGNADNTPMRNISSASVSYRATRDTLLAYLDDKPVEQFQNPGGLARAATCVPSGLKPTPACPIVSPEDWLVQAPVEDDNWWQMERIDTRTGEPADDDTPSRFVRERRMLRIPDGLSEFLRDEALGWQYVVAAAQPPPEEDPQTGGDVEIVSPQETDRIEGVTPIAGTATSEDFESYRLEFRSDADTEWTLLSRNVAPVTDDTLGSWDTRGLPTGAYTLRLVVTDDDEGELTFEVHVVVISSEAGGRGNGRGAR
jgi:membrane peptidoglycan carboxypeptidase